MHTDYFVNGKKTDLEHFLIAEDDNDYKKEAFEKAKEYYQKHEEEWSLLYFRYPKELLGGAMICEYETTEEGKDFKEKWMANRAKKLHRKTGIVFYLYLALVIGGIVLMYIINR